MNRISKLAQVTLRKLRHHGYRRFLYAALLKSLGHRRWFRVLRAHSVEDINHAFLEVPAPYTAGFVVPHVLEDLAHDPDAEISRDFIRDALAKGDKCYGFMHNGALSAYTWYATNPTPVSPELTLHFRRDYVYMYKGFTAERHRGKRLYNVGITRALRHYRALGYKGVLCYVDATNLDSMKSCARSGLHVFGSIYVVQLLGRRLVYSSPGCARFELRLAPSGEPRRRTAPTVRAWARKAR